MVLIFISAGSPESSLSDEVWKHTQLQVTARWQAESWDTSCFHPNQALFCLVLFTLLFTWGLHTLLFILVCHSVTPWSRWGHYTVYHRFGGRHFVCLVFGPWRWLDQNQNTRNIYLRTDDKRCRVYDWQRLQFLLLHYSVWYILCALYNLSNYLKPA